MDSWDPLACPLCHGPLDERGECGICDRAFDRRWCPECGEPGQLTDPATVWSEWDTSDAGDGPIPELDAKLRPVWDLYSLCSHDDAGQVSVVEGAQVLDEHGIAAPAERRKWLYLMARIGHGVGHERSLRMEEMARRSRSD